MKKFFLVVIAIEMALLIAAVESIGADNGERLERIATELEYINDR